MHSVKTAKQQTYKDWDDLTSTDAGMSHTLKNVDVVFYLQSLQHTAQRAHKTTASCSVPDTDSKSSPHPTAHRY